MKKSNEPKERQRREYAPAGERSQKMMSFRVDNDILEWLKINTSNKGRFINNVLRVYITNKGGF